MRSTPAIRPKQIAQATEPLQAVAPDSAELAVLPDCLGDVVVDRDGEFHFWAKPSAKTKREARARVKRTGFDHLVPWVDYKRARDEYRSASTHMPTVTHHLQTSPIAKRPHPPRTYKQKALF